MIIRDPSDPTKNGLFSKCARNHASRSKPTYKSLPHQSPSAFKTIQLPKKKPKGQKGFESQVSRDQREMMYKSGEVPPVGQYNPIKKQQPRLVWDILKAYSQPKKQQAKNGKDGQGAKKIQQKTKDEGEEQEEQKESSAGEQNKIEAGRQTKPPKREQISQPCMVDMLRTTGRKEQRVESNDWGKSNIMESIGYIKGSIAKNVLLGQRKTTRPRRDKPCNDSSYDYDCSVVRPIRRGMLDFGSTKGRGLKMKTEDSYSYQHYDYDSYVWQSNSRVFPSTKQNVADFDKQVSRYKHSEGSHPTHPF